MGDDADGLAQDQAQEAAVEHRGRSFFGAEDAREIPEMIGAERDVDGARLANGLAVVERFDAGKELGVLVDDIGDLQQDVRALDRLDRFPCGKRGPRRLNRGIDVFLRGIGARGEHLAGRRILRLERASVGCGHERAVDIQSIRFFEFHGHRYSFRCS